MGINAQMFVKVKTPFHLEKEQVKHLAYKLYGDFSGQEFMPPNHRCHCLEIIDEYIQDGPTIKPKKGEQLIEVNLLTRYYGEGYERGPLPTILDIASWLEANISECEVWYGGDSSGVEAELLDDNRKSALWNHFCEYGHLPYSSGYTRYKGVEGPTCQICNEKMFNCGGGGNRDFWSCYGCTNRAITRPNEPTRFLGENEDFFKVSNEERS